MSKPVTQLLTSGHKRGTTSGRGHDYTVHSIQRTFWNATGSLAVPSSLSAYGVSAIRRRPELLRSLCKPRSVSFSFWRSTSPTVLRQGTARAQRELHTRQMSTAPVPPSLRWPSVCNWDLVYRFGFASLPALITTTVSHCTAPARLTGPETMRSGHKQPPARPQFSALRPSHAGAIATHGDAQPQSPELS